MILSLILISSLSNIFASLFLKKAALTSNGGFSELLKQESILPLILSITLYLVAFISYGSTLKFLPVNKAYAVITISTQVGLIFGGYLFFQESMNLLGWLGFISMSFGLLLMAWSLT